MASFEKPVAHLSRVEGASDLPDDLHHQLRVQGFCNRVTKTMSSQASENRQDTNLSISLLESDLDTLEQETEANLSSEDPSCPCHLTDTETISCEPSLYECRSTVFAYLSLLRCHC